MDVQEEWAPKLDWSRKGATLSDKSARAQYGLTQEEIVRGIRAGKLQYREAAMHGNPWLRLLRREVEELAADLHGDSYVRMRQTQTELARVTLLAELSEQSSLLPAAAP